MLQDFLSPKVSISAVTTSGSQLDTELSEDAAFFVHGILASASRRMLIRDGRIVSRGQRIVGFPIGLILSLSWATAVICIISYGTATRYRIQQQDLRNIKNSRAIEMQTLGTR